MITNVSYENAAMFKYLEAKVTNQNFLQEDIIRVITLRRNEIGGTCSTHREYSEMLTFFI
jgi:hypothetical protein